MPALPSIWGFVPVNQRPLRRLWTESRVRLYLERPPQVPAVHGLVRRQDLLPNRPLNTVVVFDPDQNRARFVAFHSLAGPTVAGENAK